MRAVRLVTPWVLALVALLSACKQNNASGDLTQLVVMVDSDLLVPDDVDFVAVDITSPSGNLTRTSSNPGLPVFPLTLGLVKAGDALGPVRISARGYLNNQIVVEHVVETAFVPRQTRVVFLDLLRQCVGVECPVGQSCGFGGCRAEEVAQNALLPMTPETLGGRTYPQPPPVYGLGALAAGGDHSCAVRGFGANQGLYCWGRGVDGQLGPASAGQDSAAAVAVPIDDVVRVCAMRASTCALDTAGVVRCFGAGALGQLGNGAQNNSATPVTATLPSPAVDVGCGVDHACAALDTGDVYCWGNSDEGQVGVLAPVSATPVQVQGMSGAVQVAAGRYHSCALSNAGGAYCWGDDTDGQLGDPRQGDSVVATAVVQLVDGASIGAGDRHNCAVRVSGYTSCWGYNQDGQLGDGTNQTPPYPVLFDAPPYGVRVEGGERHTCLVTQEGEVYCVGRGDEGQLGQGAPNNALTPVLVQSPVPFVDVAVGARHACAAAADGDIYCWGRNAYGQLGDPAFVQPFSTVPRLVP